MVLDHELLVLDRELGYRCLSADRWGSTVNRLGPEPEIISEDNTVPLFRISADRKRLSGKLRMIQHFHRCVKTVAVYMQYDPIRHLSHLPIFQFSVWSV